MDPGKNSFLMLGIAGWRSRRYQEQNIQIFACGALLYYSVRAATQLVHCSTRCYKGSRLQTTTKKKREKLLTTKVFFVVFALPETLLLF